MCARGGGGACVCECVCVIGLRPDEMLIAASLCPCFCLYWCLAALRRPRVCGGGGGGWRELVTVGSSACPGSGYPWCDLTLLVPFPIGFCDSTDLLTAVNLFHRLPYPRSGWPVLFLWLWRAPKDQGARMGSLGTKFCSIELGLFCMGGRF